MSANKPAKKAIWMVEDRASADGTTRSFWTKIGEAVEKSDGSFEIALSAVPVNGRLVMRDPALPTA